MLPQEVHLLRPKLRRLALLLLPARAVLSC
jgi:hypothetical protein